MQERALSFPDTPGPRASLAPLSLDHTNRERGTGHNPSGKVIKIIKKKV